MTLSLKRPEFWKKKGFLAFVLLPLAKVYGACVSLYLNSRPCKKLPLSSICVGNVLVGGAGKTPLVRALVKALEKEGKKVHVAYKSYRATVKETLCVRPDHHCALFVGDEPLMMAQGGIVTWVGLSRLSMAEAAKKAGAEILIYDDGFQDLSVNIDVRGLIFSPGLKNDFVMPAGPLRENTDEALSRANVLFVEHIFAQGWQSAQKTAVIFYEKKVSLPSTLDLQKPVLAFCGIGQPDQFKASLLQCGVCLSDCLHFPDHYVYKEKDIQKILHMAHKTDSQIITTEKDFVKIPEQYKLYIHLARLHVTFLDEVYAVKTVKRLLKIRDFEKTKR